MLSWQQIYSGHDATSRYTSILDTLSFSFDIDTCNVMRPFLEKSMHELEEAVINYDKENSITKEKKQIVLAKDILSRNGFKEMKSIRVEDERLLMLEVAVIILLSLHPEKCTLKYVDNTALLLTYPEFQSIDGSVELDKLRSFANYMNFAFYFITPNYNRQHVFNIVTKITDGCGVKYITGSGKTKSTSDRVLIYNREGKIVPKPRPIRSKTKETANISNTTDNKRNVTVHKHKLEAAAPQTIPEVVPIPIMINQAMIPGTRQANQAMIIPTVTNRVIVSTGTGGISNLGKRPISVIAVNQLRPSNNNNNDKWNGV